MPTTIKLTSDGHYTAPVDAFRVHATLEMSDHKDYQEKTEAWKSYVSEKIEDVDFEIHESQRHVPALSVTSATDQVAETIAKIVETVGRKHVAKIVVTALVTDEGEAQATAAGQAILDAKFRAGQIAASIGLGEYGVVSVDEVKDRDRGSALSASFEGEKIDAAAKGEGLGDEIESIDSIEFTSTVTATILMSEVVPVEYQVESDLVEEGPEQVESEQSDEAASTEEIESEQPADEAADAEQDESADDTQSQ